MSRIYRKLIPTAVKGSYGKFFGKIALKLFLHATGLCVIGNTFCSVIGKSIDALVLGLVNNLQELTCK